MYIVTGVHGINDCVGRELTVGELREANARKESVKLVVEIMRQLKGIA